MTQSNSTLTYRLEGEGETLLLLNGGFMTFATWKPVARHLQSDYRLLFCDLRGQLLSPGTSHTSLEANVEDIANLLDELGIEAVHLLGTSFGAWVGLLLAATRPQRVRSMIAVTTSDHATPTIRQGVKRARMVVDEISGGGDPGLFHDLLQADVYSQEYVTVHEKELAAQRSLMEEVPRDWFAGLEGILTCTKSVDLRPYLSHIHCPTLVVAAGHDRLMLPEQPRALAKKIPSSGIIEHPNSGHALVVEDPDWLGRECKAFLGRIKGPPATV